MSEAYICDYVLTPIGRFGGALAGLTAALDLQLRRIKRSLSTMRIGVGQGISILLERV